MTGNRFAHLMAGLGGDAAIIPHQLDLLNEQVLLTRIPVAAQAAASFLDQRALSPTTEGAWFPWTDFASSAAKLPDGAPAYILHLGHCGSTLLSRLVEAATGRRALREPLPFRTFAIDAADAHDGAAFLSQDERRGRLSLFERVFARGGDAVVKATSICNDLAAELSPTAPVVFVYVKPATYLAAMLGGANAQTDLRGFAQMRFRRLKSRIPDLQPLASLSTSELAALCWLTEASAIAAVPRDVFAVDFDAFLVLQPETLARLCAHLGAPAAAEKVQGALTGGVMSRYAKATEHAYNAATRAAGLAEARARFGVEIRTGMAWLEQTAKRFALGEKTLQRFG